MKDFRLTDWLPTTKKEMELRGWDYVDVILFSGDAYVDHPSFGAAVIGRVLEAEGYRVAIVPQPDWHGDFRDFKKLGRPRLWFGVAPGCMDSMVNKYTANRRLRSEDAYSPDGRHDLRPEYPTIVYSQILKRLYPDVPVILGGIEASLRRLATTTTSRTLTPTSSGKPPSSRPRRSAWVPAPTPSRKSDPNKTKAGRLPHQSGKASGLFSVI